VSTLPLVMLELSIARDSLSRDVLGTSGTKLVDELSGDPQASDTSKAKASSLIKDVHLLPCSGADCLVLEWGRIVSTT